MATKRKFSPAQLAAQKLFAQRARAGTLGKGKAKKRKRNPAQGTSSRNYQDLDTNDFDRGSRSKNPIGRSRSGPYAKPGDLRSNFDRGLAGVSDNFDLTKNNPIGRSRSGKQFISGGPHRSVFDKGMGPTPSAMKARKKNPVKKPLARAINPSSRPASGFAVHHATARGDRGKLIALFAVKGEAVEYAKAYVKSHKKPVCIIGKGVS